MPPANLGQPIDATLNYQPGGNPLAGLAGGLPGLAMSYGADYNAYLAANQKNYNNIIQGYGTVMQNVASSLGQGGDWGVATPAANQIMEQGRRAAGGAIQNSINSGVGKSTAAVAAQRGVTSDTQQALGSLGASLANTYAGYQANLGSGELAFMNSVNAPPPNAAAYGMLAQQYGQTQQQAANMAMQQQALDQQQRASNQAASRAMAGGGRGVSIPQMPRGGTYGSGSGGFPSGGGFEPTNVGGDPYGFLNQRGGGGWQSVGLGGGSNSGLGVGMGVIGAAGGMGYDPWATNSDPYGGQGGGGGIDPAAGNYGDRSGMFGNTGLDLYA